MSAVTGHATTKGTARYHDRMVAAGVAPEHYRLLSGSVVSSLGIGTYLGGYDDQADAAYLESIVRAVELGTNLIDTAINYRFQRSERTIGAALRKLVADGTARRDEIVIASKAGFIPFDGGRPSDPEGWVRENVIGRGLATADEVVRGHCMTPAYLRDQIERSMANLGVDCIDLYYLHNPESQLAALERREFLVRVQAAMQALEEAVADGLIRAYGVATWSGFRLEPEHRQYLSVEELVRLARAAVGQGGHHFAAIQLPFSVANHEALSFANQPVGGDMVNTFDAANGRGVAVVGSGTLGQGELTSGLPDALAEVCPGLTSDAHRALQFARSATGITTSLVGMGSRHHVDENLALARVAPVSGEAIGRLFAG